MAAGETPVSIRFTGLEMQRQGPSVTSTAKYRGLYPAVACDDCRVAIDGDVEPLGLSRVVVEGTIHNGTDISLLGLTHSGHVYE